METDELISMRDELGQTNRRESNLPGIGKAKVKLDSGN
jgi:hypothetical protein